MTDKQARENQIEIHVEKRTDRLDRAYMNGKITTEEYRIRQQELTSWADAQYDDLANMLGNQRGESDLDLLLLGGLIMALIFILGGLWMDGTIAFQPWERIGHAIETAGRP
jgi:hypothetical protein